MKNKLPSSRGFTLVELLVVMSILGVLVTLIAGGFRSAQIRGRDAQRKSDLKQIANSLELFLNDHAQYPTDSSGSIVACPWLVGGGTACAWGSGEMTDGKTVYFKTVPKDPGKNQSYYYRVVPGSSNQKFQIYAHLENTQDQDCLGGDCQNPTVGYICGTLPCNFAVTSANTSPTE